MLFLGGGGEQGFSNKLEERKAKKKRRVLCQVRWPFGPPHLTLRPSKNNKNKRNKSRTTPTTTIEQQNKTQAKTNKNKTRKKKKTKTRTTKTPKPSRPK